MNQYRNPGVYWTPRSKKDFIDLIVKSGKWNGTKQALKDMEVRQLRGIFHAIRQRQFTDIMRQPVDLTNQQAQVGEKTEKKEEV